MKTVNFVGYSGSGKTTLILKLLEIFTQAGLTVSAVKDAHHDIDVDKPGKDSYRFRQAGAAQVIIHCEQRWALMVETPEKKTTLKELIEHISPCDLLIIEGFKSEEAAGLRVEVWRETVKEALPISKTDKSIEAIVTDRNELETSGQVVLDINNPQEVASWIAEKLNIDLR